MLGSLISAGASIIGGLMGKDSADKAREQQAQHNAAQLAAQKEFAQQGLTWKIDDAFRNADRVHPIYSMGASTPSYTPVSSNFTADTSMANAMHSAGQDIGRAVNATASSSQRTTAFTDAVQKLQIEGGQLDNDLKRAQLASQVARLRQNASPPMPIGDRYLIDGQSASPVIKDEPMKRTNVDPVAPHSEPGAIPDVSPVRTDGGLMIVPSKDVKDRIEDSPYEWTHFWRNMILPAISQSAQDRQTKAFPKPAPGHVWKYIPFRGEYQQVPINEGVYNRARRMWN